MWVFTLCTTFLAWLGTILLIYFLYPIELTNGGDKRATVIVLMISPPICIFIAQKIRENTLLSDELERLVNRDRLTDVATRDFFFTRMEREPDSYGVSLMIDIDHFKMVNDTHGHLVGVEVIKCVGTILRDETRALDIVCRFGGEEFVVFLYEADKDLGLLVAERIRMSVETASTLVAETKISVTVSIGGSLKERMEDINVSINQADAALYRAKDAGRNRTVVDWMPTGLNEPSRASSGGKARS
jgi:diguanylate cyclase (GGDEF)-like protein